MTLDQLPWLPDADGRTTHWLRIARWPCASALGEHNDRPGTFRLIVRDKTTGLEASSYHGLDGLELIALLVHHGLITQEIPNE